MTDLEIAIKIGVPTPKTSLGLTSTTIEVYTDSYFYWFARPLGLGNYEYTLCYKNSQDDFYTVLGDYQMSSEFTKFIAPQMHEIATLLPKSIDSYLLIIYNDLISYENPANEILISVKIENNHYAESFAKLYLKLNKE